ncbi:hypothetical protein OPV22_027314 [Ensete ventricosum]|uniref:Uncharacterized protein n=1 Tax=Ensete ventricosum TaxID=4639 RepID=A0AAV8P2W4_ENSVE|nr:hypothetical protein OPV22_027314 [Ensete ventricosum]
MSDGGQERGIRCGTVPTPLSVGMGAACEITKKEMQYDSRRISSPRLAWCHTSVPDLNKETGGSASEAVTRRRSISCRSQEICRRTQSGIYIRQKLLIIFCVTGNSRFSICWYSTTKGREFGNRAGYSSLHLLFFFLSSIIFGLQILAVNKGCACSLLSKA